MVLPNAVHWPLTAGAVTAQADIWPVSHPLRCHCYRCGPKENEPL